MNWHEDPNELKRVRRKLGIKQSDLAKHSNVPRAIIANIETGRRRFTKDVAKPLWDALANMDIARRRQFDPIELEMLEAEAKPLNNVQMLAQIMGLKVPPAWPTPEPNLMAAYAEIGRLTKVNQVQKELIACLSEIVDIHHQESTSKDEHISELEAKVTELRNLYELGVEASLANERFEEARAKLSAEEDNPGNAFDK